MRRRVSASSPIAFHDDSWGETVLPAPPFRVPSEIGMNAPLRLQQFVAAIALLLVAVLAAGCASGSDEKKAVALVREARVAARADDLDRAEELLEAAHAARPGFVDPLMLLANLEERRGDLPAARDAYERVLQVDPTLTAAGVALALTHLRDGDLDAGEAWLRRAIESDPGFEPAAFNLGALAERRGQFVDAAAWYEVCAVLAPRSTTALVRLGGIQIRTGEFDAAARTIDRLDTRGAAPAAAELAEALRAATSS